MTTHILWKDDWYQFPFYCPLAATGFIAPIAISWFSAEGEANVRQSNSSDMKTLHEEDETTACQICIDSRSDVSRHPRMTVWTCDTVRVEAIDTHYMGTVIKSPLAVLNDN